MRKQPLLVAGLAAVTGLLGVILGYEFGRRSVDLHPTLITRAEITEKSATPATPTSEQAEIEHLRAEVARLAEQLRRAGDDRLDSSRLNHAVAAQAADALEQARLTALPKETLRAMSAQIFDLWDVEFTQEGATALGLTESQRQAGNHAARQLEARLRQIESDAVLDRRQVGDGLEITLGDHRAQTAAAFEAFESELAQRWSPASLEWFRETQYRDRYASAVRDGRPHLYRLEPDPHPTSPGQYRFAAYADPAATEPTGGYVSSSRDFFYQRYGRLLGANPNASSAPIR